MKAFSLIELIFVIAIMGILTFLGVQYIPDEKLPAYTQMLKAKIMEKKSNALGCENCNDNNLTCIKFDKEWLKSNEANLKIKFDFNKSYIDIDDHGLRGHMLCFDYLGRDYNGSVDNNLTYLIHTNIIVTVKRNDKDIEQNITIYPVTGTIR